VHVCHFSSIEPTYVNTLQHGTSFEHPAHVCDVLCIEVAQINICQRRTSPEHHLHIFDVVRLEVLDVFDGGKFIAIIEPVGSTGQRGTIGK
jgi:hypothetical protein